MQSSHIKIYQIQLSKTFTYLILQTKQSTHNQSYLMEQFEASFQELKQSIRTGVRDHSLVSIMTKRLTEIKLQPALIRSYSDNLFKLYDLSNSSIFVKRPPHPRRPQPITLDDLAISIKTLTLKMLAYLVAFFNDHPQVELPHNLMQESLEIMVMLSRVLLDLNKMSDVRTVYQLVITFRQAVGQVLCTQTELAHWLNVVELQHIDIDSRKIDVYQFKKGMENIKNICKMPGIPQGYLQFAQHLTFQVILKLLKKGQNNEAKALCSLLPQKMLATVSQITNIDSKALQQDSNLFKISPFYSLYLQIKNTGIQNISQQRLRIFLATQQSFNDARLFDVVALTGETLPLQIWFQINLNTRAKNEQIQSAYKCFVYVLDINLQQKDSNFQRLSEQLQSKVHILNKFLQLSKLVMVTMLSQKKQNGQYIIHLVKRLTKLLIQLVITLNPNTQIMQQFAQKLLLICNKYSLNEVGRSITCILFYYQLIMGIANQESYNKLCKINLLDKSSELFRILKVAYEFRNGKTLGINQEKQLLRKQPFIVLLFAKQPYEQLILRFEPKQFAKMSQKWQAYLLLLHSFQETSTQNTKIIKFLTHLEDTLIYSQWQKIKKLDIKYIEDLSSMLADMLNKLKQSYETNLKLQLCLVLLYLSSLKTVYQKVEVLSCAVLLNRYSKLLKLLSLANDEGSKLEPVERNKFIELQIYLTKSFMSFQLQKMKINLQSGEATNEAGLMVLIDLLHQFVLKHQNNFQSCEFFTFVRFQMLCITDSVSDSEINYEKNGKLLKLYCSSKYIKKQTKLKIMRKLIKEDLFTDSRILSLADLSELIVITDDPKQRSMYASHILRAYGQQGKTYLILQSGKDPKSFSFLYEAEFQADQA